MRAHDTDSCCRRPSRAPKAATRRRTVAGALVICSVVATIGAPALALHRSAEAPHRYLVRRGDTLSAIAHRSGVSVQAVVHANAITDPNLIVVGRTLVIPVRGTVGVRRAAPAPSASPRVRSSAWTSAVNTGGRRHPSALGGSRLRLMPIFEHWAHHYGMRSDLLKALCYLESGWHSGGVSSAGAVGIGQLMPDTATFMSRRIGLPLSRWNPEQNIHMSAKYLRWLLDQTGWNVRRAVGSYYEGLGAMRTRGMDAGTIAYVNGILALQTRF